MKMVELSGGKKVACCLAQLSSCNQEAMFKLRATLLFRVVLRLVRLLPVRLAPCDANVPYKRQ
jgi:hypothetical protein